MVIALSRNWQSSSIMRSRIGLSISSSNTVTTSAVVNWSICCSLAISAWFNFFLPVACVICAGLTDKVWLICILAASITLNDPSQSGGNCTILVELGSASHTAAMAIVIVPVCGFFNG